MYTGHIKVKQVHQHQTLKVQLSSISTKYQQTKNLRHLSIQTKSRGIKISRQETKFSHLQNIFLTLQIPHMRPWGSLSKSPHYEPTKLSSTQHPLLQPIEPPKKRKYHAPKLLDNKEMEEQMIISLPITLTRATRLK